MGIETLARVSAIGFRVSIIVCLIGLALTALTFWKLNIREIYLIRSGKAKRKVIGELEEHNRETGKLRDTLDLDYTTGSLKKTSKKLGKKSDKPAAGSSFKAGEHSGQTGAFQTAEPVAERIEETVQLDSVTTDYESRMDAVYQKVVTGELAVTEQAPPGIPFNIISHELIIHTDEIIEI